MSGFFVRKIVGFVATLVGASLVVFLALEILPGDPALSILMHLSAIAPTWSLLPANFAHNVYFGQIETRCQKIVSVGRVKWIEGTKHSGKDNAAWYLFDGEYAGATVFHGRSKLDLRRSICMKMSA